jgi:hypothetical protein
LTRLAFRLDAPFGGAGRSVLADLDVPVGPFVVAGQEFVTHALAGPRHAYHPVFERDLAGIFNRVLRRILVSRGITVLGAIQLVESWCRGIGTPDHQQKTYH